MDVGRHDVEIAVTGQVGRRRGVRSRAAAHDHGRLERAVAVAVRMPTVLPLRLATTTSGIGIAGQVSYVERRRSVARRECLLGLERAVAVAQSTLIVSLP